MSETLYEKRWNVPDAIAAIERMSEGERGPFNTSWPFDVVLKRIQDLEALNQKQAERIATLAERMDVWIEDLERYEDIADLHSAIALIVPEMRRSLESIRKCVERRSV